MILEPDQSALQQPDRIPVLSRSSTLSSKKTTFLISFFLLFSIAVIYWPVRNFEYVNFDDHIYVSQNPIVQQGLTWEGFRWAFTNTVAPYAHPLAWLSHMLDFQIFGNDPGAQHLVNVGWHAVNALLLFFVLKRMTGATWRSALVALLFALHPLRVESVAWITERKDVLCAFFWILTMGAYACYARKTSALNYAWVTGLLVLGLLAKPTLVTLPAVFLLLDFWPLRRLAAENRTIQKLLLEKIPWFALCGVWSWFTAQASQASGMVVSAATLPLSVRAENAVVSYFRYLEKTFWPVDLSALYPYRQLVIGEFVLATIVLLVVTFSIFRAGRHRDYLLVGWLWFLGVLFPVIGLVQVGTQSMADRFTYIPHIGLFIGLVWLGHGVLKVWPKGRLICGIIMAMMLVACGVGSARQARYWQNTETLFQRVLTIAPKNYIAHATLGWDLMQHGKTEQAIGHFHRAIAAWPDYVDARAYLADAFLKQGKVELAIEQFEIAVQLNSRSPLLHKNLANALAQKGRMPQAVNHLRIALQLSPGDAQAHSDLGNAFSALGNVAAAEQEYLASLRADPRSVGAHYNLAVLLAGQNRVKEAVAQYREALRLQPEFLGALNNLAWILATSPDDGLRDGAEAVKLAEKAVQVSQRKEPLYLDTLHAAYAEAGRYQDAIATAQEAHQLFVATGQTEMVQATEQRLELYRAGKPFRE